MKPITASLNNKRSDLFRVKWVINTSKAKDGIDLISHTTEQIIPVERDLICFEKIIHQTVRFQTIGNGLWNNTHIDNV
jgi:hypothetical protein